MNECGSYGRLFEEARAEKISQPPSLMVFHTQGTNR